MAKTDIALYGSPSRHTFKMASLAYYTDYVFKLVRQEESEIWASLVDFVQPLEISMLETDVRIRQ